MATPALEIVCGVDASDHSVGAARLAARLAAALDAGLALAHVADPTVRQISAATHLPALRRREEQESCRLMEECARRAHVTPSRFLSLSDRCVSSALAALADRTAAALLVVGARGSGRSGAVGLGSVARELPSVARRPVMIVPPDLDLTRPGRSTRDVSAA